MGSESMSRSSLKTRLVQVTITYLQYLQTTMYANNYYLCTLSSSNNKYNITYLQSKQIMLAFWNLYLYRVLQPPPFCYSNIAIYLHVSHRTMTQYFRGCV